MMAETNGEKKISEKDPRSNEKKMENFECPFTWEMSDLNYTETEYDLSDNEEVIPLMKLMRCIVHVYEYTKNNKDSQAVLEKLSDCDNAIIEIQKSAHPEISIEAVLFVLRATKCFVFLHLKMEPELKQIFAETKSIDSSDKKQTSTVKACKSIAWSNYLRQTEAIKFIRKAIADNPNCDLWYFILGKMLRSNRQAANFSAEPDADEIESFEKAYDMMKNPVFGVFLGKAYSEHKAQHAKALEIYERFLPDIPENDSLYLEIAYGRIQMKNYEVAKYYLDKVVTKSDTVYLHYRGLYHSNQEQYKACLFFEEAIKYTNLQAEYNYIYSIQKINNKNFNLTQHLLQMLDKYRNWPEHVLQTIILQLAYTYFKKDNKIKESLEYFLKAIEIDPDAMSLKDSFRPALFCPRPKKNVYEILTQFLLPIVGRKPHKFDENTNEIVRKLREYCNEHYIYLPIPNLKIISDFGSEISNFNYIGDYVS